MAKKVVKTTSLDQIESALSTELTAFVSAFRAKHDEEIYGVLIEISREGFSAHGSIATEEGLTRFANECLGSYKGDLSAAKKDLRWAGPENGWYQSDDKAFRTTNAELSIAQKSKLYDYFDRTLTALCLKTLKSLDENGLFGTGVSRAKMVIGICYVGGDNSDEEFLGWAKQVNPKSVYTRLSKELAHKA